MTDVIGEYIPIVNVQHTWDGPVAECKKGRDQMQANTKWQQQQAQNSANQAGIYNGDVQSLLSELMGSTTPGSMSPAAAAMYANDMQNLVQTYNGLKQGAFAAMNAKGWGSAPSGFSAAAQNAINQGEGQAATSALRQGQINTANQRSQALSTAAGMTGLYNNSELGNTNASSNSALDLSRMGSTLGDVLSGVSKAGVRDRLWCPRRATGLPDLRGDYPRRSGSVSDRFEGFNSLDGLRPSPADCARLSMACRES